MHGTTWDPCTLPRSALHWFLPAAGSPPYPAPCFLSLQGAQPQGLRSCPHFSCTLLGGGPCWLHPDSGVFRAERKLPWVGSWLWPGPRGCSLFAEPACGWGAVQQRRAEVCSFRSRGGRLRLARPQTSAAAGRCPASACVLARLSGHFCADKGQEEEGAGGLGVLSGSSQGSPQSPVAALPAEGAGGQTSWGCH